MDLKGFEALAGSLSAIPARDVPAPSDATGTHDRACPTLVDVVDPVLLIPPDGPIRAMSRTEAGLLLDRELVKLAGMDHRCRLVRARLLRRLMDLRGWRALGFVRLSDYSRERLGTSPRSLEEDARVLKALDSLPGLRAALFDASLSWTQARLLSRVATADTEQALLERAAALTTRDLEALVRKQDHETASVDASVPVPAASEDPTSEDGEPTVRWSTLISQTGLRIWRSVCEVARRAAGSPLSNAQVLELVVAEAASGVPEGADDDGWIPSQESMERRLLEPRRRLEDGRRRFLEAFRAEAGVIEGFEWLDPASRAPGPAEQLDALLVSLERIDAFELDRRLRELGRIAHRIDYQMAALLRIGSDRRLFREVGFATLKLYMESRLGCSSRRLWSLLAIERESWRRGCALRDAWREGRISHLAASIILPVVDEISGEAWVRRAGEVTLRRLEDEVAWALDHGERPSLTSRPAPPPLDAHVPPGGLSSVDLHEVQMRAHGESLRDAFGPCGNARLVFSVPISVAVLLETQLRRYRHRLDPAWRAFERIVAHALLEWTSVPRHRDPVFERDGWRCAVPCCSSRRNLHDHHVVFRSHGGDNDRTNRITACAGHHLHHIHAGIVRAEGRAPDGLEWAMGCAPGRAPAMRLHGDRYAALESYGCSG